jgi:Polysaccharide deacetylase
MPIITSVPRLMSDGTKVIHYTDTVGTSYVSYIFEKEQESIIVRNKGLQPIIFTVGPYVDVTLNPGQSSEELLLNFESFSIKSSSGVQQFEVKTIEKRNVLGGKASVNEEAITKQLRSFKKGRFVEKFDNISQWNLQGGYQQTLDPATGKVKLTSNGTATFSRKTVDLNLSGVKVLKLRVYIENLSNLSKFTLYLSNDTNYTNFLSYVINASSCVEGWNEFYIDTTKFTVSGTGSFTNDILSMQIRVEALASTQASVIFHSLVRDETQKPMLIFTFDDGWDSQYTEAFKRMKKKGIPGMIAVVPSLVDTSGYMTLAQLKEVYNYGWDLSNHTYDHVNLKNVDKVTAEKQINDAEKWLKKQGFFRAADVVVYPQGGYNNDVIDIVKNKRAARSIVEGIEPGIPCDKYKIKIRNVLNTVTPATANGWIDEIINTGGTLVLLWHKLVPTASVSTEYSIADFQTIVDYAYSKRDQVDIVTFTEYLDRCGF